MPSITSAIVNAAGAVIANQAGFTDGTFRSTSMVTGPHALFKDMDQTFKAFAQLEASMSLQPDLFNRRGSAYSLMGMDDLKSFAKRYLGFVIPVQSTQVIAVDGSPIAIPLASLASTESAIVDEIIDAVPEHPVPVIDAMMDVVFEAGIIENIARSVRSIPLELYEEDQYLPRDYNNISSILPRANTFRNRLQMRPVLKDTWQSSGLVSSIEVKMTSTGDNKYAEVGIFRRSGLQLRLRSTDVFHVIPNSCRIKPNPYYLSPTSSDDIPQVVGNIGHSRHGSIIQLRHSGHEHTYDPTRNTISKSTPFIAGLADDTYSKLINKSTSWITTTPSQLLDGHVFMKQRYLINTMRPSNNAADVRDRNAIRFNNGSPREIDRLRSGCEGDRPLVVSDVANPTNWVHNIHLLGFANPIKQVVPHTQSVPNVASVSAVVDAGDARRSELLSSEAGTDPIIDLLLMQFAGYFPIGDSEEQHSSRLEERIDNRRQTAHYWDVANRPQNAVIKRVIESGPGGSRYPYLHDWFPIELTELAGLGRKERGWDEKTFRHESLGALPYTYIRNCEPLRTPNPVVSGHALAVPVQYWFSNKYLITDKHEFVRDYVDVESTDQPSRAPVFDSY